MIICFYAQNFVETETKTENDATKNKFAFNLILQWSTIDFYWFFMMFFFCSFCFAIAINHHGKAEAQCNVILW